MTAKHRTKRSLESDIPLNRLQWYRRFCLVLGLLLAISWGAEGIVYLRSNYRAKPTFTTAMPSPASPTERVSYSQPGPWGNLEYTRIATEIPTELISADSSDITPAQWFFKNYTAEKLTAFIQTLGLPPSALASFTRMDRWKIKPEGIWITPEEDLVLNLTETIREKIYNELLRADENLSQRGAFTFRESLLNERLEHSGLSENSINLFRQLLYSQGPLLHFCDTNIVMRRLSDKAERIRFLKMLSRKNTLLAKLCVRPDSDVEALVRYWGLGGRAKDIRPLLQALNRVPGGSRIDIVHLLPPMVRQRLYTYPAAFTDFAIEHQNCTWTSLNFFEPIPNDKFMDPKYAGTIINSDYEMISAPAQMGDLIIIGDSPASPGAPHSVFHVAVYVADDIVFTKNGSHYSQPWIFQKLSDMFEIYIGQHPSDTVLKFEYARRKNITPG